MGHAFALRRSLPGFRARIRASMFPPNGNVLKYWWCYCERQGIIHSPGSLFDIKVLLIISLLLLLSVWILHYYCVICIVNSSKVQQFQLNCTLILGFQYEITVVNNKIRPLCRYIDSFPNSLKKPSWISTNILLGVALFWFRRSIIYCAISVMKTDDNFKWLKMLQYCFHFISLQ